MSLKCILQGQDSKNLVTKVELNEHIADKNNPHEVTAKQVGALSKEVINLPDGTDFNNIVNTGLYKVFTGINAPIGGTSNYKAFMVLVVSEPVSEPRLTQLAISYYQKEQSNRMFIRTIRDEWSDWRELSSTDQLCNPNLLDNWYFGNPVNQRGLRSYANSSGFYGIDRWRIASGLSNFCYVEINDGYVSFVNANTTPGSYIYFEQNFEYDITPTGVPRTVSIMDKGGILRSYTGPNNVSWEYDDGIYVYQGSQKSLNFRLDAGKRLDMKAVKLELGSQQTLAHQDASGNWVLNDPPPNPALELAKCQRYFIPDQQRDCYGRGEEGHAYYVVCPTPVSLRTMPAISTSVMGQMVEKSGTSHSVNGISPIALGDSSVLLQVTTVAAVASGPCVLRDAHFSLSADL